MPKRPEAPTNLDPELQHATTANLFNYTWTLLEKERTLEEDDCEILLGDLATLPPE